jgi:N-acetylneuraminate synthase
MSGILLVAEIGINHNGDLAIVEQMIRNAAEAGCDFVKFQMRTVEDVYTAKELDRPRESPFGTTNREQKMGLEFNYEQYLSIANYCQGFGIQWFASPWDCKSVDRLMQFDPPYIKLASACNTDRKLLLKIMETKKPVIISTGMSTKEEMDAVMLCLGSQVEYILACTSTYPTADDEMNLMFIKQLQRTYNMKVGFSNHHPGITYCQAAAVLGAEMIEFHYTLDRSMYGSDQASSIETPGMVSIRKFTNKIKTALGDGNWTVFDREKKIREKLRR